MSFLVTRPAMPVPRICEISTLCSSAILRTRGDERCRIVSSIDRLGWRAASNPSPLLVGETTGAAADRAWAATDGGTTVCDGAAAGAADGGLGCLEGRCSVAAEAPSACADDGGGSAALAGASAIGLGR